MKLQLFIISTLFFTTTLLAQNVNIPDAIFKHYLVTNTAINTNGDGEISEAEAAAFTDWIIVDNKGIADLTGIEAFLKTPTLWCSNNNLKTLDVSKNKALVSLWCDDNKLTELDVSNNPVLQLLRFERNNLTAVDLSKNTMLTYLRCEGNKLTSLDLTKNSVLTVLYCYNNNLTTLDLGNNASLTSLGCGYNFLITLDVSKTTSLKFLNCYSNKLTSLNVNNNTALIDLYCDNNTLTTLNVSKNTALIYLSCSNNTLTTLDVRNGNNINLNLQATNNPKLLCISADDVAWAEENWKNIDSKTSFNTSCFDNYFQAFYTTNILVNYKPLTVTFTDQSGGKPTTWFWDFGDGTTSTKQHTEHTFLKASDYTVSLRVTKDTDTSYYSQKITATKRVAVRDKINPFAGKARSGAVSFVIDTMAYVGLGRDADSCFTDMWQFSPLTDIWTEVAPFPGKARSNAVAFVLNTEVYVGLGGNQVSSTVFNDFYSYNPKENTWKKVPNFGGTARSEAVAFVIGDTAYLGTGANYINSAVNQVFADFWKYNPKINVWSQIASPTQTGRKGAMGFAIDGKGYLTGGDGFSDMQEYSAETNTWKTKIVGDGLYLNNYDASVLAEGKTAFICYGNKKKVVSYNPKSNILTDLGDVLNLQAERYDGVSFLLFGAAYFGQGVKYGTFAENYKPYYQNDMQHIDLPFVFAPEDIILSNDTIAENNEDGKLIGIFNTVEKIDKDSFTYELTDGYNLYVDKDSLKAMATNYEIDSVYNITVKTTDSEGNTLEKAFVIKVKDRNDAPSKLEIVGDTVLSDAPLGTLVGTFKAYDEDSTDTHIFKFDSSLSNADTVFYSIIGDSLVVADTINKDDLMHNFYVLAIDAGGLEISTEIFIDIIEGMGIKMVESAENKFKIYPNPVCDFVTVQSINSGVQLSELVLLNAMGKVVSQKDNINATSYSVNTSGIKPGIYFLMLKTKQGSYIQKIVKE